MPLRISLLVILISSLICSKVNILCVIRVARTIADLEEETKIERHHLSEAIQFRSFDRGFAQ
ncbi:magnesium chelatase subunit ChlI family protein [Desulfobacula toluolica]|uniref:magnesium chelatase subunit ChlI family protein n=1 Tax=Desulfobacula toluolica TaxID=28223 RepID=UPI00059D746B|nr:hypothetical protein [Desulfobacula toluolica]